ncbi:MAG: 4'-phosphopantetheinyl transferase superfamily protein [Pseudomonadota bacterium]
MTASSLPDAIPWIASAELPSSAPGRNEIHLWSAGLRQTQADESLLDAGELQRALTMAPQRRDEFSIGRTVLRRLLAQYLDLPPEEFSISIGSNGKPLLNLADPPLHFSLAHCRKQLMIAFAHSAVGLDLETPRPVKSCLQIARRLFQPRDIQLLESFAGHQQQEAFFRLWTAYEAAQKMHGEGLFGKYVSASYNGQFMLDDGTIGAVCIDQHAADPVEVRCFVYDS